MPTYVYACAECGEFEAEQRLVEPALERCPGCGRPVRRVIAGGTSAIVKGGSGGAGRCDRATPCCGRAVRCERPPCGH